ncbi:hypothetical protein JCM1393_28470 [Clostridium carnis]
MSINIIKLLLIGTFILTIMVIIGTIKIKNSPSLLNASKEDKIKGITLIKNLWKNQIIMAAISITLLVILFIVEDNLKEFVKTSITIISEIFVVIAALMTVKNYNKFKVSFSKLFTKFNN